MPKKAFSVLFGVILTAVYSVGYGGSGVKMISPFPVKSAAVENSLFFFSGSGLPELRFMEGDVNIRFGYSVPGVDEIVSMLFRFELDGESAKDMDLYEDYREIKSGTLEVRLFDLADETSTLSEDALSFSLSEADCQQLFETMLYATEILFLESLPSRIGPVVPKGDSVEEFYARLLIELDMPGESRATVRYLKVSVAADATSAMLQALFRKKVAEAGGLSLEEEAVVRRVESKIWNAN